ncbi:glycosyl transferase, group 1 family protein [Verrucomicrobiia bacterium DG1235]|nr:glycosyl transferase, group 1 family protein [Verrucomicrobiae bacterium DG1235]
MKVLIHDYAGHPFVIGLSRELARRGMEVVHSFARGLLTPRGILKSQDGDPDTLSFREIEMNANYRRDKYKFVKRRKYEIEYGRAFQRAIVEEKPDIVLSGNTPSEPQWLGVQQCTIMGIPFVSWVQDFYSIAVSNLAGKKSYILGKLAGAYYRGIDRKCFRDSAHVIPISEDFMPMLSDFGVSDGDSTTIENWGVISDIPLRSSVNSWSVEHGLDDKRVLMYSGTLAMKHNPAPLATLAERMKKHSDVRVVVISEGPGADYLARRKQEEDLHNLVLLPFQPFESLADVLGSAEMFLALLEPEAGVFSVPSKVLSYLCAGKPTVAAMPKENLAARLLTRLGAGIVVDPGDELGFLEGVDSLLLDREESVGMGASARAYAEENFSIGTVADRFEAVFSEHVQVASSDATRCA